MYDFSRRAALGLGAAAAVAARAAAQPRPVAIPRAEVPQPSLPIEAGAALRVIRPARFVEPDEAIFRQNASRFSERYGVPVRIDFVGWEDIRPQTAVIANTGSGPDIVIGWADDPHVYADKLHELTDVAEYLGARYGGWNSLPLMYGRRHGTERWIGIPFGGGTGPLCYRASTLREAGFDRPPDDLQEFLRLCTAMKAMGRPAGFALGNAVGDGNGFANWMLWAHNASLTDAEGKVSINSPETVAALDYVKELYPQLVPGTLSWLDVSNNRAYAAQEVHMTANGVSLYYALKNDPRTRPIAEDTEHAWLPRGRADDVPQSSAGLNAMVFRHVRHLNAAKQFIIYMMEAEQYDPWLTGSMGYWSQPLAAYKQSAVWNSDRKLEIFRDAMNLRRWAGYKGPITQAAAAVNADYVLVQMFASVASGQSSPRDAAREAERRARRHYRA